MAINLANIIYYNIITYILIIYKRLKIPYLRIISKCINIKIAVNKGNWRP